MRRMLGVAPETMEGKSRVGGGKKTGERGAGKFLRGRNITGGGNQAEERANT